MFDLDNLKKKERILKKSLRKLPTLLKNTARKSQPRKQPESLYYSVKKFQQS